MNNKYKKVIEEFDKEFGICWYESDNSPVFIKAMIGLSKDIKQFLISSLGEQEKELTRYKGKIKREWYLRGYNEGRQSVFDEEAENQRKLLQGFAYKPKDKKI